ncbi:hypothetical protein SVAN01_10092 [Stagonosporopsis vannaccii]|nr:hypothetical protein SVAN01_10092 [Stagonosporopsis vannaccii]
MATLPSEPAVAPVAAPSAPPAPASTDPTTAPPTASNTGSAETDTLPTTAADTPAHGTTPPPITLRAPSTSSSPTPSPTSPTLNPPPLSFLRGSWTVTHSTLPMWRKARNVTITYTPIANSGSAGGHGHVGGTHLDDVVTYQPLDKGKGAQISTVRGVDKPAITAETHNRGVGHHVDTAPPPTLPSGEELASLGYTWRGKGWLMIATSKWEILGYGDEEGGGNQWVVTYFAKTLFTPAGIDFYSRKGRLRAETVEGIKTAIKGLGSEIVKLSEGMFEVALDGEREA